MNSEYGIRRGLEPAVTVPVRHSHSEEPFVSTMVALQQV